MRELRNVPLKKLGKLKMRLLPMAVGKLPVSILHEELPVFSTTPAVYHKKTHEYVIVLRGRAAAVLDGRRFSVRAGTIFDIPAGSVHKFVTGRSSVEALSIFAPPLSREAPDVHVVQDRRSKKTLEVRLS